jgi:hypothetical protein
VEKNTCPLLFIENKRHPHGRRVPFSSSDVEARWRQQRGVHASPTDVENKMGPKERSTCLALLEPN